MIRPIEPRDYGECLAIYNHYIVDTTFTFETEPLTLEVFSARIERIRARYPYFVCTDDTDGHVLGYSYLDKYSERGAYRFTCDLSIYVAPAVRHMGYGHALYAAVEEEAVRRGIYMIISIVTSVNPVSAAFHEAQGFVCNGVFEHVAFKHGKWLGVRYYQKEIRPTVGIPEEPAWLKNPL